MNSFYTIRVQSFNGMENDEFIPVRTQDFSMRGFRDVTSC